MVLPSISISDMSVKCQTSLHVSQLVQLKNSSSSLKIHLNNINIQSSLKKKKKKQNIQSHISLSHTPFNLKLSHLDFWVGGCFENTHPSFLSVSSDLGYHLPPHLYMVERGWIWGFEISISVSPITLIIYANMQYYCYKYFIHNCYETSISHLLVIFYFK